MNTIDLGRWKPSDPDPRSLEYAGARTAQEVYGDMLAFEFDAKHNAADTGPEYTHSFSERSGTQSNTLTCATRLLRHMGNIFREQAPPSVNGICFVDSKLRRRMQEKKAAMGHKRDDHEELTQQQQRL